MKTVILDFINVVADLDVKLIFDSLPLKHKLSATKILLNFKDHKDLFDSYQKGELDLESLKFFFNHVSPTFSNSLSTLSNIIPKFIYVNQKVLDYVQTIRSKGVQVLLMSNSIPETEQVMEENNLNELFDGIILSTQVQSIKPEKEIYEYAIEKYNISTKDSIMIDDTKKNLKTAESLGIEVIHSCNSEETCEILDAYLSYLDIYNPSKTYQKQ